MAEKVNEPVIAYKGFKRDMTCKGYQYEDGKTYTTQTADVCNTGFHACEYPLDVFDYYPPGTSVYHEVQQSGEISRDNCDTKQASTKIKIGAELSIRGLVKAAINYTKARTTTEQVSGNRGASVSGDGGASVSGDMGASVSGDRGASVSGDMGASVSGDRGASVSGDGGASVSGNMGASVSGYGGASTSGNMGASVSGDGGASVSGDGGASVSRGKSAVGESGIAYARGEDAASVKVKGGIGSILVLVTENDDNCGAKSWKVEYVDGERIKADTWYRLKNSEFVEVGEDD